MQASKLKDILSSLYGEEKPMPSTQLQLIKDSTAFLALANSQGVVLNGNSSEQLTRIKAFLIWIRDQDLGALSEADLKAELLADQPRLDAPSANQGSALFQDGEQDHPIHEGGDEDFFDALEDHSVPNQIAENKMENKGEPKPDAGSEEGRHEGIKYKQPQDSSSSDEERQEQPEEVKQMPESQPLVEPDRGPDEVQQAIFLVRNHFEESQAMGEACLRKLIETKPSVARRVLQEGDTIPKQLTSFKKASLTLLKNKCARGDWGGVLDKLIELSPMLAFCYIFSLPAETQEKVGPAILNGIRELISKQDDADVVEVLTEDFEKIFEIIKLDAARVKLEDFNDMIELMTPEAGEKANALLGLLFPVFSAVQAGGGHDDSASTDWLRDAFGKHGIQVPPAHAKPPDCFKHLFKEYPSKAIQIYFEGKEAGIAQLPEAQKAFDFITREFKDARELRNLKGDVFDFSELKHVQESLNKFHEQGENIEPITAFLKKLKPEFKDLKIPLTTQQLFEENSANIKRKLPPLPEKKNVADFYTIQPDNRKESLKSMRDFFERAKIYDSEVVIQFLFDCVKRRQNFSQVIEEILAIDKESEVSSISLFNFMMHNSEPTLRSLLVISCAQYMAIPLISWDFWAKGKPRQIIHSEIFSIFEKSTAILQLKGLGSRVRGCTTFFNQCMGKTFRKNEARSAADEGIVEIQFDYNMQKVEHIVACDAHGSLSLETLQKIAPLFDTFILHEDDKGAEETTNLLRELAPQAQILQIVHSTAVQSSSEGTLQTRPICSLNEMEMKSLVKTIQNGPLSSLFTIKATEYSWDIERRLRAKKSFVDLIEKFEQLTTEKVQLVLLEKICRGINDQEDLSDESFLPMLHLVSEKCYFEKIDYEKNQGESILNLRNKDEASELKEKLGVLSQKMSAAGRTQIVKDFEELFEKGVLLQTTFFLTSAIKDLAEKRIQPLEDDKKEVVTKMQKEASDELKLRLEELKEQIKALALSQEMFSREVLYLSLNSQIDNSQNRKAYQAYVRQSLLGGQPVELIDGDNLIFHQEIIESFADLPREDWLVISVIGPQSSGKSLLMNFLFGTTFLSSSGRCTKGIYCSIIRYYCPERQRTRNIFLIDSEGIQSGQARNERFDRRIVYFIMCISHVILLCSKGEQNKDMNEIVKLVADAKANTVEQVVENPTIYIVMNMLAEKKESAQSENVNGLIQDLLKLEHSKTLQITMENVIPLGIAFESVSFGPSGLGETDNKFKVANYPSKGFAYDVVNLKNKILKKFIDMDNQKAAHLSIQEYVRLQARFWAFTGNFQGLIDYRSLEEKWLSQMMKKKVEKLQGSLEGESQRFSKIQQMAIDECNRYLAQQQLSIDEVTQSVRKLLTVQFEKLKEELCGELTKFSQQHGINYLSIQKKFEVKLHLQLDDRRDKMQGDLDNQVEEIYQSRCQVIGNTLINKRAQDLLEGKRKFKKNKALFEFEEIWSVAQSKIRSKLTKEETVKERVFNIIVKEVDLRHSQYKMYDKQFTHQWIEYEDNPPFHNFLEQLKKAKIIVDISHRQPINLEQIKGFIEKPKRHFDDLSPNPINEETVVRVYDWKKAVLSLKDQLSEVMDEEFAKCLEFHCEDRFVSYVQMKRTFNNFRGRLNGELNEIGVYLELSLKDVSTLVIPVEFHKGFSGTRPKKTKRQLEPEIIRDFKNLLCQPHVVERGYFGSKKNISKFAFLRIGPQYNDSKYCSDFRNRYRTEMPDEQWKKVPQNKRKYLLGKDRRVIVTLNRKFKQITSFLAEMLSTEDSPLPNEYSKAEAVDEFFSFVRWNEVIKSFEERVLENLVTQEGLKKIQGKGIFDLVKAIEQDEIKLSCFNNLTPQNIQLCSDQALVIINDINKELRTFGVEISTSGIGFLLLALQIQLYRLSKAIANQRAKEPLRKFIALKVNEQKRFVAKLCRNFKEQDAGLAKKIALEMKKLAEMQATASASALFEAEMEKKAASFKKSEHFAEVDSNIERIFIKYHSQPGKPINYTKEEQLQIDQAVKMYTEPSQYLEEVFNSKWEVEAAEPMKLFKDSYHEEFKNLVDNLITYFKSIHSALESSRALMPSIELFTSSDEIVCNSQAAEYLRSLLLNKEFDAETSRELPRVDPSGLNQRQRENLRGLMYSESISDLGEVLRQSWQKLKGLKIIAELPSEYQQVDSASTAASHSENSGIIDQLRQKYQSQFFGCKSHCPNCRRQCDQEHKELGEDTHACKTGHQFQGMGGSRDFNSQAILMSCSDIPEGSVIEHECNHITWAVYKDLPEMKIWDFGSDLDPEIKAERRQKNERIWEVIGRQICEYYKQQNIEINYAPILQHRQLIGCDETVRNHFILLLDSSFSMWWSNGYRNVVLALKTFLETLSSNNEVADNIEQRVTLIQFTSNYCKPVLFEGQEVIKMLPDVRMAENLEKASWWKGSNYCPPLLKALELVRSQRVPPKLCSDLDQIVEKQEEQFKPILYFMSDGYGEVKPGTLLQFMDLKNSDLSVHMVGMGKNPDMKYLANMSEYFRECSCKTAVNFEELKLSLMQIIPNRYQY